MNSERFEEDDALGDAQLARAVEDALRGLGIASNGVDEAELRSAVAELGRGAVTRLAAPSLVADRHWELRECPPSDD